MKLGQHDLSTQKSKSRMDENGETENFKQPSVVLVQISLRWLDCFTRSRKESQTSQLSSLEFVHLGCGSGGSRSLLDQSWAPTVHVLRDRWSQY